jgi:cobalt-zinc-cadmium resistance protein CzcA
VILVSRIRQLRDDGLSLREAIRQGSELQLRPVLMAAMAAAIGLVPASVATGIGSEAQRPLARVVVGGMISSAVLILLVLPAMYQLVHRFAEGGRRIEAAIEPSTNTGTVLGD